MAAVRQMKHEAYVASKQALPEGERRFKELVELLPETVFETDAQGRITFVSRAAFHAFGYAPEDMERGLNILSMIAPEDHDRARANVGRVLTGEDLHGNEYTALRKDGSTFPAAIYSTPIIRGGRVVGLRGFVTDITPRKLQENQLLRYSRRLESVNAELERSNRALQEFTYTVSHDLQEPLRKIHAFGEFLAEDCGEDLPPAGLEHLRCMLDAAQRMKRLIQHLLSLSRVGTQGGELVPVETAEPLARALDTLSERVRECGAEVRVEGELPRVVGDAVQVEQVFQNLVGNAMKFRARERAPQVTISFSEADGQVTFAVRDNGIGIAQEHLERVFGVFRRLHGPEEREGEGIGLALCRRIVERHGGSIWAESQVGQGTTFLFTLQADVGAAEGGT